MPAKSSDADFEHAIQAYVAGEGAEIVAARFHVGQKRLTDTLKTRRLLRDRQTRYRLIGARNGVTQRAAKGLPDAEIVRRYQAGEAEQALAKAFDVSRSAIEVRLRAAGVERRDIATASRISAAQRTPEENRRIILAAQASQRGKRQPLRQKVRRAQTRQERQIGVSPAETLLCTWLTPRLAPIPCIPQYAVGPYNVDLAIDADPPLAVEIFGGKWHGYGRHVARAPERARYLLDQGWNLIIVWCTDGRSMPSLSLAVADYIVTFFEQSRHDPTLRSQYRVIWGDAQEAAISGNDVQEIALVPTRRAAKRARATD